MTRTTCSYTRRARLGAVVLGMAALTATAAPGPASAAPPAALSASSTATAATAATAGTATAVACLAVAGAATTADRQLTGLLAAAQQRSTTSARPTTAAAVVGTSLLVGGTLLPGDSLRSPSGRYELLNDASGELLLQTTPNAFQPSPSLVASIAAGPAGSRLVLQADGNLVYYGPDNAAYFDTGTTTGTRLEVQDDGNVVLYGAGGAVAYDFATAEPEFLDQGGTLLAGERLTSEDGRTSLVMQTDGNLVLYTGGVAVFATGTSVPGSALVFQDDGNAVVYSPELRPLFATRSSVGSGEFAVLAVLSRQFNVFGVQGDDLTSLYGSAWGTSTVESGALLFRGDRRTAPGGRVLLILQTDGNLVQYVDGRARFRTGTRTPDFAIMQPDGNFLLYRSSLSGESLSPVFQTGTDGFPGSRLVVQADGNIVVYTPGNRAVFSTLR